MCDSSSNLFNGPVRQGSNLVSLLVAGASPKMLIMGVASVAAGTASAALRGNLEILPATMCLIFALLFQIAGTYWHIYVENRRVCDTRYIDDAVEDDAGQELSRTRVLREAAFAFLILDAMVGLALLVMSGLWSLVVGCVLALVVYLTFGGSRPLSRSPWGIICTFLLFGPVGVMGTCMVQSGQEASYLLTYYDIEPALYISVVMGLMAVNCNIVHNIASLDVDRAMGRRTIPMAAGERLVRTLFVANGIVWTAIMACLALVQNFNIWEMMIVPVLTLGVNSWLSVKLPEAREKGTGLQLAANLNMLFLALAMLVVALIDGAADDSARFIF